MKIRSLPKDPSGMSAGSNMQLVKSELNSQPEELQGEESDEGPSHSSLKDIAICLLPKDFHYLLYGGLTVTCAIYAVHTADAFMLNALWVAAAGYIGIDPAKGLIDTIKGSSRGKTSTPKLPTTE